MSIKNKKAILIAISVLFLVALAILLYIKFRPTEQNPKQTQQSTTIGHKVLAPEGTLSADFPKELALDSTAQIKESFSIPYQTFTQATTTFLSKQSVTEEYNSYLGYLQANNFQILSKSSTSNFASMYGFKNGTGDINISISGGKNQQTTILVSFLAKPASAQ